MTPHIIGFFAPWIIYSALLVLHFVLPARRVKGYVKNDHSREPLEYRLNGLPVMIIAIIGWILLGYFNVVPYNWLYINRWQGLAGACTLGLIVSFLIVITAPPIKSVFIADFFLGRRWNPQFFDHRVDVKMFLYLAGATLLALNILSFAAHHILLFKPDYSPSVILYSALFFWFLVDYMTFERVHLYTYDLFAERVGFKLTWGCLTFYPYFYCVGLWATAHLPNPEASTGYMVASAVIFFTGWTFARGANMQKFYFKTNPEKSFLGIFAPSVVTDGTHSLLCGGFWAISRHVNYLGEILMATGLTLALGYPQVWWIWLYPLYYVLLLTTRERDDDKRCHQKYGPLWDQYTQKVPHRIIPRIY